MSSVIAKALLEDLDADALERLAELLAPHLAPRVKTAPATPWKDVTEAAEYLRCSRQGIYDRVHAGTLVPHRDGRRLLFHRDSLDAALDGRQTAREAA